jgi:hypothetical protein
MPRFWKHGMTAAPRWWRAGGSEPNRKLHAVDGVCYDFERSSLHERSFHQSPALSRLTFRFMGAPSSLPTLLVWRSDAPDNYSLS